MSKSLLVLAAAVAVGFDGSADTRGVAPGEAPCVVAGCKVNRQKVEGCATITGDIAASPGHGECKCDGTVCVFEKHCNETVTLTFAAPDDAVLCKGSTSYGATEQVTLSVTACGARHAAQFEVRLNDCNGAIQCTAYFQLWCPQCTDFGC